MLQFQVFVHFLFYHTDQIEFKKKNPLPSESKTTYGTLWNTSEMRSTGKLHLQNTAHHTWHRRLTTLYSKSAINNKHLKTKSKGECGWRLKSSWMSRCVKCLTLKMKTTTVFRNINNFSKTCLKRTPYI